MSVATAADRFGNPLAPGLPYARGKFVTATEDDHAKLRAAWALIRSRGVDAVHNLSGLERRLPLAADDLAFLDDDVAPALFGERLTELGLEHLGGNATDHDILVCNRLSAALLAATLAVVEGGGTVVGVSARYSHPAVTRATRLAGGAFIDTTGLEAFKQALDEHEPVMVALTRLTVSYEVLALADLERVVQLAHDRGVPVLLDDAGGARVGPVVYGQPRLLELGVDVGATGLDKYGVDGPRVGLLGGVTPLVERARARAFELGLECRPMLYPAVVRTLEGYSPDVVRERVVATRQVGAALRERFGARVFETDVTVQLPGEEILDLARERAGAAADVPLVPYEATAAVAMLLLRDHGFLTVHFAGLPPGTSALLLKFVPPEVLERVGGPAAVAEAVDNAVSSLAGLLREGPEAVARLLFGSRP